MFLDTTGAGLIADSVALTADPRRVVTLADPQAPSLGVRFTHAGPGEGRLDAYPMLAELLVDPTFSIRICRTYPLKHAHAAHQHLETHGHDGKIVLTDAPPTARSS